MSVDYAKATNKSPSGMRPTGGPVGRRRVIPVLIAILVVLLGTAAIVWAVTRGAPNSVDEVAAAAVDAGENLDLDAGIDLLCEAPTTEQREGLESVIARGKSQAGTSIPDVNYSVTGVQGDKSGSFRMTIWSDEEGINTSHLVAQVDVEQDGDHSCISDVMFQEKPGRYRPFAQ